MKYINLLPPGEQHKNKVEDLSFAIQDFGIWLIFSLAILAVVLFATELFLRQELKSASEKVSLATGNLVSLDSSTVKKEIENFNQSLSNFKGLQKHHENWSQIFKELASILPADLAVDNLAIDRETHKIEISGHARKRRSVLKLRQNILGSEMFTNINFPLANLEKAANLPWKYRFYVKPEKLH